MNEDEYLASQNSFIKRLFILKVYRKAIFYCVLIGAITTITVAVLMPNYYKSTASVFPVDKSRLLNTLGTVSSSMKSFSRARNSIYAKFFSTTIGNIETDRCLAILKSNTVLISVIEKFDLVNVYNVNSYPIENSIKQLLRNVEFKVVVEGNILITVYDRDPQRASDMANYFIDILNTRYSAMVTQSIKSNKQIVDQYYMRTVNYLDTTVDSLKRLQKEYSIVSLSDQDLAYRKSIAKFAEKLIEKKIQANVSGGTFSINHPDTRLLYAEVEELQNMLNNFNRESASFKKGSNIYTPFDGTEPLNIEYARKYRDVEEQYKKLESMTSLFKKAEAEIQRNAPAVVVLDRAIPAERKDRPNRILVVVGGIIIVFIIASMFSIFHNNWINEKTHKTVFYKVFSELIG